MRIGRPRPDIRVLIVALALTIGLGPALAAAQTTEQRQSTPEPAAADLSLLDLATVVLAPEDLEAVGLVGYGIGSGEERSLRSTAQRYADNRGGDTPENVDRFAGFLENMGWQRGYDAGLAVLKPDDPGYFAQVVSSAIDIYETEAGANRAFTLLSDPEGVTIADVELIPGVSAIGDDTRAWAVEGEAIDTGDPYQAVLVMFRIGNMEAGVGVYNWLGEEPELALAEELAARLLERIEAAQAGADVPLSLASLRFADEGVETFYHNYLLRDGVVIPFAGEAPEEIAGRALTYADVSEVYTVNQVFAAGEEGSADDGFYALWTYRFADPSAAAAWFDSTWQSIPSTVELPAGERAFAYSYVLDVTEDQIARGYVGYVLAGDDVAIIDMRAIPEVPLAAFVEVLQLQGVCLDVSAPCEPNAVPWLLRWIMIPEATPEAVPEDEMDAAPAPAATPLANDDEEE